MNEDLIGIVLSGAHTESARNWKMIERLFIKNWAVALMNKLMDEC